MIVLEWRPIETAPKDGTEVLLWSVESGCVVGRYATGTAKAGLDPADVAESVEWASGLWSPYADFAPPVRWATHWMPLPNPPGIE